MIRLQITNTCLLIVHVVALIQYYVYEEFNHSVLREVVAIFAEALPAPTGLAVEVGALYVSDRTLGQILKLAENGETLAKPQWR